MEDGRKANHTVCRRDELLTTDYESLNTKLAVHPIEKVTQVPIATHHVHGTRVPSHR
jgi:hypothetical protein